MFLHLRAFATIIFRMFITRSMLFCHSSLFSGGHWRQPKAGVTHVTRFFYRVHVTVSPVHLLEKFSGERRRTFRMRGCRRDRNDLVNGCSITNSGPSYIYIYIYIRILNMRGGRRTNITCRKNSDIPWWKYKNVLLQRAAATVPRVHVSLQRDGDIPLQARSR